MRRYLTELLGTLALVLTVGCSVLGDRPFAAFAIGGVLAAMVYAGGHISGGHYNPAVTLAVWVRGSFATRDLLPYCVAQFVGALLGAASARFITDTHGHATTPTGRDAGVVLLAEFLFTFLLAYVVLNVATSSDNQHNDFYGAAIGTTVAVGVIAVGPLTGGAFNPAVVVGGWAMGLFAGGAIWLYLLATVVGGAAAGGTFRVLNPHDSAEPALRHAPAWRGSPVRGRGADVSGQRPGEEDAPQKVLHPGR
jgi:aquaporin Z